MGFLDFITPGARASRLNAAHTELQASFETVTIPSWDGNGSQITNLPVSIREAFGIYAGDDSQMSRREAMQVPAVVKARSTIATTIGSFSLITMKGNVTVDNPFLRSPDPRVTIAWMITYTVDDLYFYGVSYWLVLSRDARGFPSTAVRLIPGSINFTAEGRAFLDGRDVTANLIRFDSPTEGILTTGARTLRTAYMLEQAVRRYATADIPLGFFEDLEGQLADPNVFLDSWETARQTRSTGYVPRGLKYVNPGLDAEQISLSAARDHMTAEIARLSNLPAYFLNAPTNSSLTYATTESNRRDLIDSTLRGFMAAIEMRLSFDDVTPRGQKVTFDLSGFLRPDATTAVTAAVQAVSNGLMTKDEARKAFLGLPPMESSTELPSVPPEPSDANSEPSTDTSQSSANENYSVKYLHR